MVVPSCDAEDWHFKNLKSVNLLTSEQLASGGGERIRLWERKDRDRDAAPAEERIIGELAALSD
jgi:hypothetical protein